LITVGALVREAILLLRLRRPNRHATRKNTTRATVTAITAVEALAEKRNALTII